ncbi:hypothetical protein F4561_001277 [Lipingzhangella halophila]|uniref:DUF2269 domain-containing protein n=1 Tax=Lipingzhangella halophila TaxID=1783352 RepID=A0A7W7RED2_9ACTN|nr:hypothetical protein [Lipingzhangella halophila]MBB4930457.1 hypothetical protein [Lipingzhangella halophila]
MAGSATAPGRLFKLGVRARKGVLAAHIVFAGAWIGIDATLGILVITGLLTADPGVAATCFQALQFFAVVPMFTVSLACLGTGVVLGLGTKYGLLRYWWVAAKLAINLVFSALIVFALRPDIELAADYGRQLAAGTPTLPEPTMLLFPVFVAPTLLLIATLLAVFKPWGRIRRRSERAPRERVAGAASR